MVDKVFNVDTVVDEAIRFGYVLTPVPDSLTIHWAKYSLNYDFDEVFDGASLVWVDVMQDTFNSETPEYDWTVDDPGILYAYDANNKFEDAESSPIDLSRLQEVANVALDNYRMVFDRLVDAGVSVVNED